MRRRKKEEKSYIVFKYGSIGAVLCNLSASTLGCSVLCIPYVFSLCGWLYGFIIICIIVLLQLISMRLLLQCQKCTGVTSIQQLTILYLKNKCGILFINIIIFGFCFTQCIAILIALADLIQPVFKQYLKDSFLANRSFLLIVVTLFILLPLSFKDKPAHLTVNNNNNNKHKRRKHHHHHHHHQKENKYITNINRFRDCLYNICMFYFLFSISIACLIRFCDDDSNGDISLDSVGVHTGIYINNKSTKLNEIYSLTFGWCIILFSLTTHIQLFKVNEKLLSQNKSKLYSISHGILIQHTIYILILGTCGYFYFSQNPNVETNIILNLKYESKDDILILTSMIVIGIAMFLFYPTVLEPSRHSMSVLIFPNQKKNNITQHILLTFIVDIFALIVALFIHDLAVLFAWSGSIFATILCLILPSLLFWNIIVFPSKSFVQAMLKNNNKNKNKNKRKLSNLSKYNLNAKSALNSIIATATPPLMNYARNVNDDGNQFEDKSSLLSGSQLSSNAYNNNQFILDDKHNNNNNNDNKNILLPNIMTPDTFNQVIAESYDRLYGTTSKKSVLMAIDDDYDDDDDDDEKYHESYDSESPSIDSKTPSIDDDDNNVSLSSHTKQQQNDITNTDIDINFNLEEEPAIGSYNGGSYNGTNYHRGSISNHHKNKNKNKNKKYHNKNNKNNKNWWKAKPNRYKQQREISREQSRTINYSQSKTNNLREASRTIQERIEQQLNQEKMSRIKTLEKVNQSWTFWFDRFGALLLLISGVILFLVGNFCNIVHMIDKYKNHSHNK